MGDWLGIPSRESTASPLLDFRLSLQSLGLLRKHKGSLLITRVAAGAQRDPRRLWDLLADKIIPSGDGFEAHATLLLLAHASSSAGQEIALEPISQALTHLGWRHRDGGPLEDYELYDLRAFDVLTNVSAEQAVLGGGHVITPAAAALARAALRR